MPAQYSAQSGSIKGKSKQMDFARTLVAFASGPYLLCIFALLSVLLVCLHLVGYFFQVRSPPMPILRRQIQNGARKAIRAVRAGAHYRSVADECARARAQLCIQNVIRTARSCAGSVRSVLVSVSSTQWCDRVRLGPFELCAGGHK